MGFRCHPQARPWYHLQTRQADGGCEYVTLQQTSAFHFLITWQAKAELSDCSLTSATECPIALLPPAVHNEELRPQPGWLHFAGGLWENISQLPLFLLHSRNWQVRKLHHTRRPLTLPWLQNKEKFKQHELLTYSLFCCTLEIFLPRQGQISREEITSYFMRGMSVCAKLGYNFKDAHNFHETTYKRPTFCCNCGGFVSNYCICFVFFLFINGQSNCNMTCVTSSLL